MYAVVNVEKFLRDAGLEESEGGKAILDRAESVAVNGVFSGADALMVMGSAELALIFDRAATTDPTHIAIWVAAVKSGSVSAENEQ